MSSKRQIELQRRRDLFDRRLRLLSQEDQHRVVELVEVLNFCEKSGRIGEQIHRVINDLLNIAGRTQERQA